MHRRGADRVGYLADLSEVEHGAVLYLRLWCDGPDAQAQVWNDFASRLGPRQGRTALEQFERLCLLAIGHARHPLMRRAVTCRCLGAHEAIFANFVETATHGDREDAILMASLLVRTDVAAVMTDLAQRVGLNIERIGRGTGPACTHTCHGAHRFH